MKNLDVFVNKKKIGRVAKISLDTYVEKNSEVAEFAQNSKMNGIWLLFKI